MRLTSYLYPRMMKQFHNMRMHGTQAELVILVSKVGTNVNNAVKNVVFACAKCYPDD